MNASLMQRMRRDLDEGFAMIIVIITMLVVTTAVTLAITLVTSNLPQSRHDQDWNAALGAAQAGVDDYRRHLNDNDAYWQNNGVDSSNPALVATGGRTFPGTTGTTATYRYRLLTTATQTTNTGLIRLRATGTVNKVNRTITVDLRKVGFLKYGYLENYGTVDPALYPALGLLGNQTVDQWTTQCSRRYWDSPGRSGCADTYLGTSDLINGPFHSNDAVMLNGHPTFTSPISESSWPSPTGVQTGSPVNYRQYGSGSPSTSGYGLVYAPVLDFPKTNTAIAVQTTSPATGCLYTGPTQIVLQNNGTMNVLSPYTRSTNPGCSTSLPMTSVQNVRVPANGVVYIQNLPASSSDPNYTSISSCPTQLLGTYPPAADNVDGPAHTYDCHNGDVFVQGTLSGQLTIAAANNVIATGDIKYLNGITGTDVLGLVANNYVTIYHPVSCPVSNGNIQSGPSCTNLPVTPSGQPLKGIEIDAALLSLKHAFTLQNFNDGPPLSTAGTPSTYRHIVGAVINQFSAVDATGDSNGNLQTGLIDQFDYDSRLLTLPPPYFLLPTVAPWTSTGFSEEKPGS